LSGPPSAASRRAEPWPAPPPKATARPARNEAFSLVKGQYRENFCSPAFFHEGSYNT
jgi:hypothetical protein